MERGVDEGEGGEEGAGQVRAGEDKRQTPSTLGPYTRQTAYFRSHTAIIETSAVHLMICRCCRSPPIQKCYYHDPSRTVLASLYVTDAVSYYHDQSWTAVVSLYVTDGYYHDPSSTVFASLYVTDDGLLLPRPIKDGPRVIVRY